MIGKRRTRSLAAALTILLAASGAAIAEEELPRYRLVPGMELTFKGSSTFKFRTGMHLSEDETTAWVVRRNDDGSVRIVLRQGSRFTATSALPTVKNLFTKENREKKEPMEYHMGYIDLFPDGRVGPGAEQDYRIHPESLFPRLPETLAQARSAWTQRDEQLAIDYRSFQFAREPDGWRFLTERVGPDKAVYGMKIEATVHFEARRGLVRRIEEDSAQEYGFQGKGTGATELTDVATRDAAWLKAFSEAADRYFAASQTYEKSTQDSSRNAGKAETMLADAMTGLQRARETITEPIFREQLDRQIKQHESLARYYIDMAKRHALVVDRPAADWELKGLDGKTHRLADYRGKVVVLDFWYRGCGWCIKAMPQLNALAGHCNGRSVAILGMNTDRKEEDAKVVIDALGLKYETLRAEGIPEKYGVQGFPTLILIDPDGVVRDVHVGYSPTLLQDLSKSIDKLLAAK